MTQRYKETKVDLRSHARKARMEKLVDKTPTNCPTELAEKSERERERKREKKERRDREKERERERERQRKRERQR